MDNRNETVDALRGLAALGVCVFHYTLTAQPGGWLRTVGDYGRLGVDVFFVISGFIVPHAMLRGHKARGDQDGCLALQPNSERRTYQPAPPVQLAASSR